MKRIGCDTGVGSIPVKRDDLPPAVAVPRRVKYPGETRRLLALPTLDTYDAHEDRSSGTRLQARETGAAHGVAARLREGFALLNGDDLYV